MKLTCDKSLVLGVLVLALAVSLMLLTPSPQGVDTTGWRLAEFIDHLHHQGIRLRVIPTTANGLFNENAYLTEDPDETWSSLQQKPKMVKWIDRWSGSVYVERVPPHTEVDRLPWGECGCQVGDFVLFGDRQLLYRIQQAFR